MTLIDKAIVFAKENKCMNCSEQLNRSSIGYDLYIFCDKCSFRICYEKNLLGKKLTISYFIINSNFFAFNYYGNNDFSIYKNNHLVIDIIKNVDYILSKQDIENYLILK